MITFHLDRGALEMRAGVRSVRVYVLICATSLERPQRPRGPVSWSGLLIAPLRAQPARRQARKALTTLIYPTFVFTQLNVSPPRKAPMIKHEAPQYHISVNVNYNIYLSQRMSKRDNNLASDYVDRFICSDKSSGGRRVEGARERLK